MQRRQRKKDERKESEGGKKWDWKKPLWTTSHLKGPDDIILLKSSQQPRETKITIPFFTMSRLKLTNIMQLEVVLGHWTYELVSHVSNSKFTIWQGFWFFSRDGGRFPSGSQPGSTRTQAWISRSPTWAFPHEPQMPHQTSWVWDSRRRKHGGFPPSESLVWSWRLTAIKRGNCWPCWEHNSVILILAASQDSPGDTWTRWIQVFGGGAQAMVF